MNVSVVNDGSTHSGDDDPAASSTTSEERLSGFSSSSSDAHHQVVANTPQSTVPAADRAAAAAASSEEDPRLQHLRSIIDPDGVMSSAELRDILDQNERVSARTRTTISTARTATSNTASERTSTRTSTNAFSERTSASARTTFTPSAPPRGGSHRWERCQAASSRPGVVNVGGPITGQIVPVGQIDEIELIQRKINAVHEVQGRLKFRDLQSKKQEVERMYEKEKRMLEGTRSEQSTERSGPQVKTWDPPSDEMLRREPTLPPPGPLPLSFNEEGADSGVSNSEIAVGKFFDPGDDEEEKQEEDVSIADKWSEVTLDDSELGAYEHVVRCWKCRAGLKINIEIGLVVCPRCRSISPTTDVTNVG